MEREPLLATQLPLVDLDARPSDDNIIPLTPPAYDEVVNGRRLPTPRPPSVGSPPDYWDSVRHAAPHVARPIHESSVENNAVNGNGMDGDGCGTTCFGSEAACFCAILGLTIKLLTLFAK